MKVNKNAPPLGRGAHPPPSLQHGVYTRRNSTPRRVHPPDIESSDSDSDPIVTVTLDKLNMSIAYLNQPWKGFQDSSLKPVICTKCKTLDFVSKGSQGWLNSKHKNNNCDTVTYSISKDQSLKWYKMELEREAFNKAAVEAFKASFLPPHTKIICNSCKITAVYPENDYHAAIEAHKTHEPGKFPQRPRPCRLWVNDLLWASQAENQGPTFHFACVFCCMDIQTTQLNADSILKNHLTGFCKFPSPMAQLVPEPADMHCEPHKDIEQTYRGAMYFFLAQVGQTIGETDYLLQLHMDSDITNSAACLRQREDLGVMIMPLSIHKEDVLKFVKQLTEEFPDVDCMSGEVKKKRQRSPESDEASSSTSNAF